MKMRQRIMAYMGLYTPKLLPYFLRAAIAQIEKNGMESMMQSLYKGSKFDYELYNQTETRDIFINGFQSCIAHGIESLMNDSKCISSTNWQHLITECPVPLELYHATDDPVVLLNHVKAVLEGYDHIPLTIIEGGQMILYKFPEKLLENM